MVPVSHILEKVKVFRSPRIESSLKEMEGNSVARADELPVDVPVRSTQNRTREGLVARSALEGGTCERRLLKDKRCGVRV